MADTQRSENTLLDWATRDRTAGTGLISQLLGNEAQPLGHDMEAYGDLTDVMNTVDTDDVQTYKDTVMTPLEDMLRGHRSEDGNDLLTSRSSDYLVVKLDDPVAEGQSAMDAMQAEPATGQIGAADVHRLSDMTDADFANGTLDNYVLVDTRTDAEKSVDSTLGSAHWDDSRYKDVAWRGTPSSEDGQWTFSATEDTDGLFAGSAGSKLEYDEETHLLTLRTDTSLFGTMDQFNTSDRNGVAWDVSDKVPSLNEHGEWQIRVDDPSTLQWSEDGSSVSFPDKTQEPLKLAMPDAAGMVMPALAFNNALEQLGDFMAGKFDTGQDTSYAPAPMGADYAEQAMQQSSSMSL